MDSKKVIRTKKKGPKVIIKKIKKQFQKLINKYNKLDEYMKKIIVTWTIISVIILIIIVSCIINKHFVSKYTKIEEKMNDSALNYVKEKNLYPTDSNPLLLELDAMIEYDYIKKDGIDDSCEGYSKIIYNDEEEKYEISSYITCSDYTTKGYKNNK